MKWEAFWALDMEKEPCYSASASILACGATSSVHCVGWMQQIHEVVEIYIAEVLSNVGTDDELCVATQPQTFLDNLHFSVTLFGMY
jgi:hypothetical protein